MFETLYSIISSPIGKGISSAIISYTTHYAATKIYSETCIPTGIQGFLQGLVSVGSPVCQLALQTISITQVSYTSLVTMGLSRMFIDLIVPSPTNYPSPTIVPLPKE